MSSSQAKEIYIRLIRLHYLLLRLLRETQWNEIEAQMYANVIIKM